MCKIILATILLVTSLIGNDEAVPPVNCGIPPTNSLSLSQSNCAEFAYTSLTSTTEGATLTFFCQNLLIRTSAAIDYCPVIECLDTGAWRFAKLTCGGATECYNSSSTYKGRRMCSKSGRLCQRWDAVSHSFTDSSFPDNNMTLSEAYCRDPDGFFGVPWCYTGHPATPKEECGIPHCSNITIGQGKCPSDYCGDPSPPGTDNNCANAKIEGDFTRNVGTARIFKCNTLLTNFVSAADYCPVQTCQNNYYYSDVSISCGNNECYSTGQSQLYQGRRTCTKTGLACQRWDSQSPSSHTYTSASDFPDASVSGAGAYCRDPKGDKGQPWCYVANAAPGVWDVCDIPNCSALTVDNGLCPAPAVTASPPPTTTLAPPPTTTTTLAPPPTTTTTTTTTTTITTTTSAPPPTTTTTSAPPPPISTTSTPHPPTTTSTTPPPLTTTSAPPPQTTTSTTPPPITTTSTPPQPTTTITSPPTTSTQASSSVTTTISSTTVTTTVPAMVGLMASANCGAPTYTVDVDQSCIELGGVIPPNPTTEGATLAFSCASLLIRTKAPFDYCPVKRCQNDGLWSDAKMSCGAATECFNSSSTYKGRRTCTVSGRSCQRWDSQSPQPHSFTDSSFPNNNMTESAAYCRDPDGVQGEPWCYTNDTGVLETCGIPPCASITIGQGTCPGDYCGDPVYTFNTDNSCVSSTSTTDGSRHVGSYIEFRCLSLLTGFISQHDYCPLKVCQSDTYWGTSELSCGTNECYTSGLSQQYQGRRTCTKTGKSCQSWDSQVPNSHPHTNAGDFPDATVSAAGSYCRDPGGIKGQPWCFTTTAGTWDYCGVQVCSSLPINNGTCDFVASPTTTAATSTTASATSSAALSTSTPIPSGEGDYYRYHRVNNDRAGFQKLTTIPFVRNALGCARLCSEQYELTCVFLTFEIGGTCSLYKEEILNLTDIPCTTQKCYIHNNLL